MKAHVVKITRNEDGDVINNPKWCLVITHQDSPRTFCGGEVFGYGEGSAEYEEIVHGVITCKNCIDIIKWIKSIK